MIIITNNALESATASALLIGLFYLALGLFNKRVRVPGRSNEHLAPAWFVGIWRTGMMAFGERRAQTINLSFESALIRVICGSAGSPKANKGCRGGPDRFNKYPPQRGNGHLVWTIARECKL